MTTDNLSTNGTALPKPEAMLLAYMTVVRTNDAIQAVALAEPHEIMWEIIEMWENQTESIDDDDSDTWMAVAGITALAVIALCQAEQRAAVR
jgi:hypothetical protein